MEIKRKFLLNCLPLNVNKFKHYSIEKAYISFDPKIKIVKINNLCYLIKNNDEIIKQEIKEDIYNMLKEKYIENNVINKTKYLIPLSAKTIAEIDSYSNTLDNFKTVNVKFENENEANQFEIPNWFGKEITNNFEYYDTSLSKIKENNNFILIKTSNK